MSILQIIIKTLSFILPWILRLGLIAVFLIILSTREKSGFRGVITYVGHLIVVAMGWLFWKWAGVILISLPILVFYYYMLFHLAMVVVPFCDPSDWQERRQRFRILVCYCWGVQFPLWLVTDSNARDTEVRIPGDPFGLFPPGLVWARSHQVVGLTTGLSFSDIRNAGLVFTQGYERPFGIVDLRTQLRTAWIEVVSSDGIAYSALLFTSFAVDKEKWSLVSHHLVSKANPLLADAKELDCTDCSYPFSRARVRAVFGTTGIDSLPEDSAKSNTIYWDERAFFQIEKIAREVLSQRRLDELWLPKNDTEGANAVDDIAKEIKDNCSLSLQQRGILLYSCRIVNLEFSNKKVGEQAGKDKIGTDRQQDKTGKNHESKDDEIEQQQISTWRADWQRAETETRARGEAEAELLKQEARAFAYTNLLTAVAEGLQEARLFHPQLPRYVIAIRFVSALEQLLKQQPEEEGVNEALASLDTAKKLIPLDMHRK